MRIEVLVLILIIFMGIVNAQSGKITDVKVNVVDTPKWIGIFPAWVGGDDEIEFLVTIKNTDTVAHTYKIEIWDATNSSNVLCKKGDPGRLGVFVCKAARCDTVWINAGAEEKVIFTTNWRGPCSLKSFKGIPIIKLIDETGSLIDEKVIPTYYETLTIFHEDDDELRSVSDPFNYTHQLILDEDCNKVGGDFTDYGEYERREGMPENPLLLFLDGLWSTSTHIEIPLVICEKDSTYGIVDAEVWQNFETKLPDGNTLHYLLNQQEYSNYETKTCKVEDWREDIFLHQAQYTELIKTFFKDEKFYEEVRKLYEDKLGVELVEAIEIDRAEAMADQIYCFKTHLKDTRSCYEVNYEWYSLTDTNPIGAPLGYVYINGTLYRTSYFDDIWKWNYDQDINEMI